MQHNTEFYWHYQRYSFVREYFDRPILAYPPLIIFPHLYRLARYIWKQCKKSCCKRNEVTEECSPRDENGTVDHSPVFSKLLVNALLFTS